MPLTIGEQLKQARLARNASINDVSLALHIRPFFIEALEDNRFTDIPSMVQVKGFIRLYAGWLNQSPQALLNILDGKTEESPEDKSVPDPKSVKVPSKTSKSKKRPSSDKQTIELSQEPEIDSVQSNPQEAASLDVPVPDISETLDESGDTSQNLFLQIGKQLGNCRKSLNISVEDIEKLTHIRARYLVDMEAGNFNDIPSLVQARGLLNGYASFLNLDVDLLLGTFAEALQKRRVELIQSSPEQPIGKKPAPKIRETQKERTGLKRFLTVDFMIGSITIIGLLVFGIWSASRVMSSRRNTSARPPAIAEVLAQNPTTELKNQSTGTSEPTDVVRNPDTIGQLPTTRPGQEDVAFGGSPTPPVPSLGKASMQVYIVPNQRVFLQVTSGKKVVFIGRTVPGNAYPFTSDDRIEVVSGNAAALQIYYNQRDLGTLGLSGQPLRLVFSKDGITTPTPAITSLPTNTPMATLTLKPTSTPNPPTVTPLIP